MSDLIEITVPDIGDVKSVEVIEIAVAAGDRVEAGSDLLTLESDKASMDIPSPYTGIVRELSVKIGDRVQEGSLVAKMELLDRSGVAPGNAEEKAESTSNPAHANPIPFADGSGGYTCQEGQKEQERLIDVYIPDTPGNESTATVYASPSVRRLARELGIALTEVKGNGPRNRITREDVNHYLRTLVKGKDDRGKTPGIFTEMLPWPEVDFSSFGEIERREISRIRKITGANLHRNWVTIPHVTNHDDADITDLELFRQQLNSEGGEVKVTLLALLIKACIVALKAYPEMNASMDGDEIVLKKYYNIGIAVDTPNGLVVPVIRDANNKGLRELAREISEVSKRARDGKLKMDEIRGGTFSISSLGGIGGSYFTPIINAPEVAILGVGKAREQLFLDNGQVKAKLMLPMSLSWDHRVIDGALAGRFNALLATVLGDFRRALL